MRMARRREVLRMGLGRILGDCAVVDGLIACSGVYECWVVRICLKLRIVAED
jgi:hypothetical protein